MTSHHSVVTRPEWKLRHAVAGDAPGLSLVAGATFLEAFAGVLAGADIVRHCADKSGPAAFEAWLGDDDSVATIAELTEGAAPVGYSVLTTPDLPIETGGDDIELKRIYTLTMTHGAGLGPALMARAIEDARRLGRRRILLGVYGGNARAQRFYEKQGFIAVGTRKFQVGLTEHDDLIFARYI